MRKLPAEEKTNGIFLCAFFSVGRDPRESFLFGKGYDQIDIEVHGGLTFADSSLIGNKNNSWFIYLSFWFNFFMFLDCFS